TRRRGGSRDEPRRHGDTEARRVTGRTTEARRHGGVEAGGLNGRNYGGTEACEASPTETGRRPGVIARGAVRHLLVHFGPDAGLDSPCRRAPDGARRIARPAFLY